MPHTGPHQFEMEQWIDCAPFERLLNMTIVKAAGGRAELTMPFTLELAQGAGLMHGGALVSLADTAVVMAIKSLVAPHTHFATIDCESRFLYPVKRGIVTAKARVAGHDRRRLEGRATVYDEAQREVMTFTSTFKLARDARIKGVRFKDASGGQPPPERTSDETQE